MPYTDEMLSSIEASRLCMSYLLPITAASSEITYGEIADKLARDLKIDGRIFPIKIGLVAGTLMDRLLEYDATIPLINVLVVEGVKRLPSSGVDGFLKQRFRIKSFSDARRAELIDRAAMEVYAYPYWTRVFRKVFKVDPPPADPSSLIEGLVADPPPKRGGRRGGEAESPEHKKLKEYVLKHPHLVGAAKMSDISVHKDEYLLLSGDEVDVFFDNGGKVHLVEVKSLRSNENDMLRGIYQCIKYRAVFKAQRQVKAPDTNIIVILVVEELPSSRIKSLAKLHDVRVKVVRVN
jgi:hypothetical protein